MHGIRIRERLERRRQELEARSTHIGSDLRGETIPPEGGFADQATAHSNDAVLAAIRTSAQAELQQIDHALQRLAGGLYGRCESCSGYIAPERLAAVPHATTCADCAG